MTDQNHISRRKFLKTTAVSAAGIAALTAKAYARVPGANDRFIVGIIGCGGIASNAHLRELLAMREVGKVEVVAVCDVYRTRAEGFRDRIQEAGGDAQVFGNYEDVLALEDIDYVLISTPEHSHAYLCLAALDAGKHVYCEKPLTHTIREVKQVVEKARSTGLKLQVGVQGMSDDSYASANEVIRAGKLGPVIEAQIDYVRNYKPERGPWRGETDPNTPKPDDLDWDTWLRPARKRPWDPRRYFEWRNYRDYSGGIATDLFIHRITRIIKACGLSFPTRVAGMGGIYLWPDGRELPDNMEVLLEYPEVEGITPGMTVHLLGTMANARGNQHCIRGHNATLVFTDEGWDIIDERSGDIIESHWKTGGEDVRLHHENLHAAIRGGAELRCPPELGMYGVVAVAMANESWFRRQMITWSDRWMDMYPECLSRERFREWEDKPRVHFKVAPRSLR